MNDSRFVTMDHFTGNIYAVVKNVENSNVVIIEMNPNTGFIKEYANFSALAIPTIEIQALMFVEGFVYTMCSSIIYRVQNGQIYPSQSSVSGFFVSYKVETDSLIYLVDKVSKKFLYISKIQPLNLIYYGYPMYLRAKKFELIGSWNPEIISISPSYLASSNTDNWISLSGEYLNLNNQSTVTLMSPVSNYSIIVPVVSCNNVGKEGDVCFKPNITWSVGVGYLEFNILLNVVAGSNNTNCNSDFSLIYYKPEITKLFPTTAMSGEIVTIYAPWYNVKTVVTCVFTHVRTGKTVDTAAISISNLSVNCAVPYFEDVLENDIIQVHSNMEGTVFNTLYIPAFFYYVNVSSLEYYDTFDVDNLLDNFTIVEGSEALSLVWIPYDEMTSRSLINISSTFSNIMTRDKIQSIKPLITGTDQQLITEFLLDPNQIGNLLELWILSSIDFSYIYGTFGIDPDGSSYLSLSYKIDTNNTFRDFLTISCLPFEPISGEAYKLILKTVRPDVELYNKNITAFNEWLTFHNVTNYTIPSASWRIDVILEHLGERVCLLNNTPSLPASDMMARFIDSSIAFSQSVYQNNNKRLLQEKSLANITVSIDRIWIECQYTHCNLTDFQIQRNLSTDNIKQGNGSTADNIRQAKTAVAVLSSVTVGLFGLLIFAICIPFLLIMLWRFRNRKKRKSLNSKIDAWKFDFVLDKDASSLNDERYSTFARRMYKVENQEDNKIQSIFRKKWSIKPINEHEMSEIPDSFSQIN